MFLASPCFAQYTATNIAQMNVAKPLNSDPVSQGAAAIRETKLAASNTVYRQLIPDATGVLDGYIQSNSIQAWQLSSTAVTSNNIAPGSINSNNIAPGALSFSNLGVTNGQWLIASIGPQTPQYATLCLLAPCPLQSLFSSTKPTIASSNGFNQILIQCDVYYSNTESSADDYFLLQSAGGGVIVVAGTVTNYPLYCGDVHYGNTEYQFAQHYAGVFTASTTGTVDFLVAPKKASANLTATLTGMQIYGIK